MKKWITDRLFLYHWVRISILLFFYDIFVMNLSYGLALWLRFDFQFSDIPTDYLMTWIKYIPIHTVCTLILMFAFKLYRSMWRFASFDELSRTTVVSAISLALNIIGTTVIFERMPVSYYVMGGTSSVLFDHGDPILLPGVPCFLVPEFHERIQGYEKYDDHRSRGSRKNHHQRTFQIRKPAADKDLLCH